MPATSSLEPVSVCQQPAGEGNAETGAGASACSVRQSESAGRLEGEETLSGSKQTRRLLFGSLAVVQHQAASHRMLAYCSVTLRLPPAHRSRPRRQHGLLKRASHSETEEKMHDIHQHQSNLEGHTTRRRSLFNHFMSKLPELSSFRFMTGTSANIWLRFHHEAGC